jgi:hypothetical protein
MRTSDSAASGHVGADVGRPVQRKRQLMKRERLGPNRHAAMKDDMRFGRASADYAMLSDALVIPARPTRV